MTKITAGSFYQTIQCWTKTAISTLVDGYCPVRLYPGGKVS